MELTFYSTAEGDPWGLFTEGHVDLAVFNAEVKKQAAGADWADHLDEDHTCIQTYMHEHGDDDHPWHWCGAGEEGAVAVTAIVWS